LPGQLAGTLSMPASQARHAAPWFSLRAFVIILIIIAVIIILLAGPVVAGALYEAMSRGAERAMPGMFFTGLFVLFIGIIVGVAIITFIGLGLIGAVILGWIIDNYLTTCVRAMVSAKRQTCPSEAMEPERPVDPVRERGSDLLIDLQRAAQTDAAVPGVRVMDVTGADPFERASFLQQRRDATGDPQRLLIAITCLPGIGYRQQLAEVVEHLGLAEAVA
jgi:hypothetical protein